jgi:hypothetical protein
MREFLDDPTAPGPPRPLRSEVPRPPQDDRAFLDVPQFDLLDRLTIPPPVQDRSPLIDRERHAPDVVEGDDLAPAVDPLLVAQQSFVRRDGRNLRNADETILALLVIETLRRNLRRLDGIRELPFHLLGLGIEKQGPGMRIQVPIGDLLV